MSEDSKPEKKAVPSKPSGVKVTAKQPTFVSVAGHARVEVTPEGVHVDQEVADALKQVPSVEVEA